MQPTRALAPANDDRDVSVEVDLADLDAAPANSLQRASGFVRNVFLEPTPPELCPWYNPAPRAVVFHELKRKLHQELNAKPRGTAVAWAEATWQDLPRFPVLGADPAPPPPCGLPRFHDA